MPSLHIPARRVVLANGVSLGAVIRLAGNRLCAVGPYQSTMLLMGWRDDEWDESFWGQFWSRYADCEPEDIALALDREMTLEIGLAVRAHVQLDGALRVSHQMLGGQGLKPRDSTVEIIKKVHKLLDTAQLPTEVLLAARGALVQAASVNERRNRVTHDRWVVSNDDAGLWLEQQSWDSLGKIESSQSNIEAIQECTRALGSSYWQLFGLIWLVLVLREAEGISHRSYCKFLAMLRGGSTSSATPLEATPSVERGVGI